MLMDAPTERRAFVIMAGRGFMSSAAPSLGQSMNDAARRFAARIGLNLEVSGAVGAPGAQATNVKEFQHISPLEPRPNLLNTPGALGAESDSAGVPDEYCPSRPKPGEPLGAGEGREKS